MRGIRGIGDLDSEARLALLNRELTGIDTVFTLADAKYTHLSSSFVREVHDVNPRTTVVVYDTDA